MVLNDTNMCAPTLDHTRRREEQLAVLGHLSPKPTLEEVIQLVEELSRLH